MTTVRTPNPATDGGARRNFTVQSPTSGSPGRSSEDPRVASARREVESRFRDLASDPNEFHDLMREVYGSGYDRAAAEDLRQRTLRGDTSWMPRIEVASSGSFPPGGMGAYADGTVYLNEDVLSNPSLAADVLSEEVGHHMDTLVKRTDTAGDEGEMMRRLLAGEDLSVADKRAIRAENDKGTIRVNGNDVEVEFFLGKVWDGIKGAAEAVGNAVGNAVESVGRGIVELGEGIVDGVVEVGKGIGNGVSNAWDNLKEGRVGDAIGSLADGVIGGVSRGVSRVLSGGIDFVENVVEAPTYLLGDEVGGAIRNHVTDRVFTAADRLTNGAWQTVTGMAQNLVEGGVTALNGVGKILTGRFGEGLRDLGMGALKTFVQTPVDGLLMGAGSAISAVQIATGLEPVGRELTDAEIDRMREVFGDSIDYDQVRVVEGDAGLFSVNDRAFVHGNTIYMKGSRDPDLLLHEMAHVWQFQNGGTDYMSEALWSQEFSMAYDWEPSVPGTPWHRLEPEQQAQFLEDAARYGTFDRGHPNYGQFFADVDGDGVDEDLTDYLRAALDQVKRGAGAP
ncbi:MAG TPA: hypothetical protein RMG48_19220 [Myxococcales bacterium LLY-WYZ-16_1]|nr:hypothetical protein [Myxococcales bacterium LLY-WYZ-16_1]